MIREVVRSLYVSVIFALMCIGCPLYAVVDWNPGDTITASVTDEDININGGVITLDSSSGGVNITASAFTSIVVTVTADTIIQGTAGGGDGLFVDVGQGGTITFLLNANLTFQGSSGGTDLLITFGGTGDIIFQMANGTEFAFTKNGSGGSVKAYLIMASADEDGQTPNIEFRRPNCISTSTDVTITIGPDALLGYASPSATPSTEKGSIKFLPSNIQPEDTSCPLGNMVLNIADKAGLIVTPYLYNAPESGNPVLSDFDRTTIAGGSAILELDSASCLASRQFCPNPFPLPVTRLLILNSNKTLSQFFYDPWCTGLVPTIQYGFIIGANGQLVIADNSYVDYVGLSCNVCPTGTGLSTSQIKQRNPSALTIDGSHTPGTVPARIIMGSCPGTGMDSGLFLRAGVNNNCVLENPLGSPHEFTITFTAHTPGAGQIVLEVEGPLNVYGSNVQSTTDSGSFNLESGIQILSLEVDPSGGPLFIGSNNEIFPLRTFARDPNSIPANDYYRYNSACALFNNDVNLYNVALMHTDENHKVYEKNDSKSEPTYIGGDLICETQRRCVNFINAQLLVQENIAVTGVDLCVPNGTGVNPCFPDDPATGVCSVNFSHFIFYQNGYVIDNGFGRQMILGTTPGSFACDGCTIISDDAHLNVMQTTTCTELIPTDLVQTTTCTVVISSGHELILTTSVNDGTITEGLARLCPGDVSPIRNQFSVQDIYLGHNSNISIGEIPSSVTFPLTSHPALIVHGNFFAFTTRGGNISYPEQSNVTGVGGIFVDSDGTFMIDPTYRMTISTMVTRSGNANLVLPMGQVFWSNRIGIADWNLDLNDNQISNPDLCTTNTFGLEIVPVVGPNDKISDFTLNWLATTKDYSIFTPYEIGVYSPCGSCPAVTCANIQALPTVFGEVNQFQVAGSLIGSQAQFAVDGGWVRELVYILDGHAAEAATSAVVLRNSGRIGLGTADRNVDSVFAAIVLGVNGVTIIADGDGLVDVNEDLIINNVCSILKGPNFNNNVLRLHSEHGRSIRVKSTGTLDMSSFTDATDVIELTGDLNLILEPGAKLIFGGRGPDVAGADLCGTMTVTPGGTLRATDESTIVLEAAANPDGVFPTFTPTCTEGVGLCNEFSNFLYAGGLTQTATDPIRVKIAGKGTLELTGCSSMTVPNGTYLGIETINPALDPDCCEVTLTDITLALHGQAKFTIGDSDIGTNVFQAGNSCKGGGVFQVGDPIRHQYTCDATPKDAVVSFHLNIDGYNARFAISSQGFFGLGVGIIDRTSTIPNEWLVDLTHSVTLIEFNLTDGDFGHERIFTGDDPRASLMMLGTGTASEGEPAIEYLFSGNISDVTIRGGGNLALLLPGVGAVHPIVRNVADTLVEHVSVNPRLYANIFGSKPLIGQRPPSTVAPNAQGVFDYMRTKNIRVAVLPVEVKDVTTTPYDRSNAAQADNRTKFRVGFVDANDDAAATIDDAGLIGRFEMQGITGDGGDLSKLQQALLIGAVGDMVFTTDPAGTAPVAPRTPSTVGQITLETSNAPVAP